MAWLSGFSNLTASFFVPDAERYPIGMAWLNGVLGLYALFTAALGIQAYVAPSAGKSPSVMSIVGGVGIALVVVVGIVVAANRNRSAGYATCGVATVLALGQFAPKFFREGVFYPAGVMTIASVGALVALAAGHFLGQKSS
ncbi:MAG: TMEM14 family protein [Fimbriimonadaceae bacterium]|nr:TMEM14 family protein [Fimbriimonadaceae bacterium]